MLTETELRGFVAFRCHVGHAFSLESVEAEQSQHLERALWTAVRALDESATVAERAASVTQGDLRKRLLEKAEHRTQSSGMIRQMLLGERPEPG